MPVEKEIKKQVPAIVLFDGVCNLCNSMVSFIIRHDKKAHFKFASLQSNYALQLLKNASLPGNVLSTIIVLENNKLYTRSDAALKIIARLNGLYSLLYIFIIVPRPLRNWIYDMVARNRYRWFGKSDTCMVPEAGVKERFIG